MDGQNYHGGFELHVLARKDDKAAETCNLTTCHRLATAHARSRSRSHTISECITLYVSTNSSFISLSSSLLAGPTALLCRPASRVLQRLPQLESPTRKQPSGPCARYQVASTAGLRIDSLRNSPPQQHTDPVLCSGYLAHALTTSKPFHPPINTSDSAAVPHWPALHSPLHALGTSQTFDVLLQQCHRLRQATVPASLLRSLDDRSRVRCRAVHSRVGRQHAPCSAHGKPARNAPGPTCSPPGL